MLHLYGYEEILVAVLSSAGVAECHQRHKRCFHTMHVTEHRAFCRSVYKEKLAKYVEDPAFKQCVGWKSVPELVNGRLSMLGTTPTDKVVKEANTRE